MQSVLHSPAMIKGIGLVTRLRQMRSLTQSVNWEALRRDIEQESQGRLAIVGPVNTGKSTLFNTLIGQSVAPASPDPGTTTTVHLETWGALYLADTPGIGETNSIDQVDEAWQAIHQADAVVLTFDATRLREEDASIFQRIRDIDIPTIVALNKIDLLPKHERDRVVHSVKQTLSPARVVAISALKGDGISGSLLPAILAAAPRLAVRVGRTLPAQRQRAAQSIIRSSAIAASLAGLEPIPLADIPLLLTVQARMILKIAAIYGESVSITYAKELLTTVAGGMGLRYVAQQAAKVLPGPGWLISGGIAAAGTWTIGQVAVHYYEGGQSLSSNELKQLYQQLLLRAPKKLLAAGHRKTPE